MCKLKKIVSLILLLITTYGYSQSVEYTVKAMYIEKFARFTEWDNGLNYEEFVIAILGNSPFNGELEKITSKTSIKNKPVKIAYIKDISECTNCNLVFICASEKSKLPEISNKISTNSILLISDTNGFSKKGVHINFYIDDEGNVLYEINPQALEKANLTVNMQLLKFGKIIN